MGTDFINSNTKTKLLYFINVKKVLGVILTPLGHPCKFFWSSKGQVIFFKFL